MKVPKHETFHTNAERSFKSTNEMKICMAGFTLKKTCEKVTKILENRRRKKELNVKYCDSVFS